MKYIQILHEVVLPHLLQHDGFKQVLVDAVSEIPITDLDSIASELLKGKMLTIGTLPEAANNVLANMVVEMTVLLRDVVAERTENSSGTDQSSNTGQGNSCSGGTQ